MRLLSVLLLALVGLITACTEPVPGGAQGPARILAMGDSMMAWNSASGQSVSHALEKELGEPVIDRSVPGARVIYGLPVSGALGLNISKQFAPGNWDWVVMNGGGNDLWLGCGCDGCETRLTRMISADGHSGLIPQAVGTARRSGAKVIYVGYLHTPGQNSAVDHCAADVAQLEARLTAMARRDPGVTFLAVKDVVPFGDLSFHASDRIHPSPKGSAAIGARIAAVIRGDPG